MYSSTIDRILQTDNLTKKTYLGCFSYDERPVINSYPSSFVINTQPRSKEGEHWLAMYFDIDENCYFFDSFGNKPSFYRLHNYILSNSRKWTYNMKQLQGFEPHCGVYCIFFLLFISRGKIENFFKAFSNNIIKNDKIFTNAIKNF